MAPCQRQPQKLCFLGSTYSLAAMLALKPL
jgi:hypothetical protein